MTTKQTFVKADILELLKKNAELQSRIEELTPKWIPVDDSAPEHIGTPVMIWIERDDASCRDFGTYSKRDEKWLFFGNGCPVEELRWKVTRYCPLPIPELGAPK